MYIFSQSKDAVGCFYFLHRKLDYIILKKFI